MEHLKSDLLLELCSLSKITLPKNSEFFCTRTPSQGCTPQQLNLQRLFYFPDFLHFYQEPLYGKVAALMDEIWSGLDSTKKNCFNATYELLEISVIFASKQSCECHWDNSRKISFCQLITFLLFLAVRKKMWIGKKEKFPTQWVWCS